MQIDRFVVTDAHSQRTTLPVRPVTGVYGFDVPYQDTPCSITPVNPQQFATEVVNCIDGGVGGGTSVDRLAPSIATLDAVLSSDARQKIYVDNSLRLLKACGLA